MADDQQGRAWYPGLNVADIEGSVGQDATLRYTKDGKEFTTFSVATNKVQPNQTQWTNVSVWGAMAATVAALAKKGSVVFVRGRVESLKKKDGDGPEREFWGLQVGGKDTGVYLKMLPFLAKRMGANVDGGGSSGSDYAPSGPDNTEDPPF